MDANRLSTLLWHERELLDLLLFKLEEEQLLLASGRANWLPFATREVESVLERIRNAGLERSIESSAVAVSWGLADDAPLRELVDAAPSEIWGDILRSHLEALTAVTVRIQDVRDTNLTYLRAATRATQETLAATGVGAGGYTDRGTPAAGVFDARLFDRQA